MTAATLSAGAAWFVRRYVSVATCLRTFQVKANDASAARGNIRSSHAATCLLYIYDENIVINALAPSRVTGRVDAAIASVQL